MSEFHWRPMGPDDIDGVVAVAALAFPDHFEARACFTERLALFPQGCFALASDQAMMGYLIAYPWPEDAIPPLDSLLGGLPAERETVYLHDLAIHPDLRGQGFARPIVERLALDSKSWGAHRIALVSVNASLAFWQGLGFAPRTDDPAIRRKLQSYGGQSTYMVREIP